MKVSYVYPSSNQEEHSEQLPAEEQFLPEDDAAEDSDDSSGEAVLPGSLSEAVGDYEDEGRQTVPQEAMQQVRYFCFHGKCIHVFSCGLLHNANSFHIKIFLMSFSMQDAVGEYNAAVPLPPHAAVPAFRATLDKILNPKMSEVVTARACISPKELLLNLLNLDEAHDINRTLFVNICKIINSIFSEPIIPDTSFKIDSLLLSTSGVTYHFYCKKCVKPLYNPQKAEFVTCRPRKCGTVNNVSDLDKSSYFVSFDVCTQLEIILRDPEVAAKLINLESYERVSPGMHELWDGAVHRRFRISLDFRDGALHLTIIVCADGSPLFKSSNGDITPFVASINELPFRERMKKGRCLLLGMWFGPPKPNYKTFFTPILRRLKKLSMHGAIINIGGKETFVKVHVIGGCFDSAARGPIQGIHLHNGEYGCNWCLHPGESEGNGSSARKYKYLQSPPQLRSHQQVVSNAKAAETLPRPTAKSAPAPHVNGVFASSPLLKLPNFDIVNGMVLDSMHNSFLGVVRQFLRLWCGLERNLKLPDGNMPGYYIGSSAPMSEINERIALLVVPLEFRRLVRSLSELTHWKAHELENFLLYCLYIVFDGILSKKFLTHMTLYIQGMYLLLKDIVLPEDLDTAEYLFDQYVREIDNLYQNPNFSEHKQCTYNVHLTTHAVLNARNWGNAWSASAYGYESMIGDLHDIVAANKGIPLQITRSFCKSNIRALLSQDIKSARCATYASNINPHKNASVAFVNNVKVTLAAANFRPSTEELYLLHQSSLDPEEFCEGKKLFHNNCVFAPRVNMSSRTRNDFAQLQNGKFVQIKRLIVSESKEVVLVFASYVHVVPHLLSLPSHLTLTSPFLYNVQIIEEEVHLFPHNDLAKISVYSDLRSAGGKETIAVMANVANVF